MNGGEYVSAHKLECRSAANVHMIGQAGRMPLRVSQGQHVEVIKQNHGLALEKQT